MQWRKWQNWQKIASRWRFELDAKSGPLETGDFGQNGDFGENRQRVGDNGNKRPGPQIATFQRTPLPSHLNFFYSLAILHWRVIAMSAIFANACISGHISRKAARKQARFNFYAFARPSIHFIYTCNFYARTHVLIGSQWKSTLRLVYTDDESTSDMHSYADAVACCIIVPTVSICKY